MKNLKENLLKALTEYVRKNRTAKPALQEDRVVSLSDKDEVRHLLSDTGLTEKELSAVEVFIANPNVTRTPDLVSGLKKLQAMDPDITFQEGADPDFGDDRPRSLDELKAGMKSGRFGSPSDFGYGGN